MIRVLLAEDHTIVRELLREVLDRESDIEVVGEAGDGEAALSMTGELLPDLVLMDIAMPGLDGVSVTRRIRGECEGVKVLALSTYLERRYVVQMLDAGAGGYVSKSSGRDELLRAIRTVADGGHYLCQECAAMLVAPSADASGAPARLGRREVEVLKLVAQGRTSAEIGALLYITGSTVEAHRRNIMRKLELHNVADLTLYAAREGFISI